ncbi:MULTISPECIES: ectoine/hydroxyectoine ABC transporter permease subunit EhuD [Mycolicibacterium]|uniref:ectoine/hydroxyectoine ABC transporter permease subunit EhuD n=1 Tax=Mycolicibacterium TaxID=1866885 RepID=UPI0011D48A4A|nr:ectoine/hydroxyectoine ABC transporter permease subunit EhuD [Mycolicibacterium mageritense]MBN3456664.1 ectoine/hydroxyectoine ABC transporter permease subunit EhuD [Mycobacterium sp. DSM 3803]TXI58009.1 MAG: ectoine/hydroxyectoine ABC transporter permease subunit EhuD [Mycolicibacterium mageritense]GJJ23198.1 ectoine/hydroxyectoine ABC transporter permease subunit EhuD [Mycolicibacterium mageritense]
MIWDWHFAAEIFPKIVLDGLRITLGATVFGSIVAYALGLALALLRRSPVAVVRTATWAFIEFIRSTPLLVQIFFLFFVLPSVGLKFDPLVTGVIAIGVHYSAYTAEVYRAGIEAVPAGQWEAAVALNLPVRRTWTAVILPQAVPRVLPALGNYTISMLKETPLLLTIGVLDIVGAANQVGSRAFRYVEPITIAGVLFLVLSYSASLLVRWMERRVRYNT